MRLSRPPFPPEHGSWALLACAIVLGVGSAPSPGGATATMLVVAAFSANMGRAALMAAMRRRDEAHARPWALIWAGLGLAAAIGLLVEFGTYRLLWLVPVAGLVVVGHVGLSRIRTTRRFDRTLAGELMGALGIGLLAPAAYVASGGPMGPTVGLVWLAAAAQSASGILHVRAIIGSLTSRSRAAPARIRPAVPMSAVYHLMLALGLIVLWRLVGPPAAIGFAVAYAPLILRSILGFRRRSVAPRFTRIGIAETMLSLWCAGWTAAALRGVL